VNPEWRIETVQGVTLARCGGLEAVPGIAHAFSTRRWDQRDDFDLGDAGAMGHEVRERRRRFLRAGRFAATAVTVFRQVHGATVVRARSDAVPVEADAAIWLAEDGAASLPAARAADCVPILLVDTGGRGAAAVHAGWRGTAAGVVRRALEALEAVGIPAERVSAALGPAIGPCCYTVGPEVVRAIAAACGDDPAAAAGRVDLGRANALQLEAGGVLPSRISCARLCTACRPELFFSYRRDGPGTGRMMAAVGAACP
jgi:hypothetical protein